MPSTDCAGWAKRDASIAAMSAGRPSRANRSSKSHIDPAVADRERATGVDAQFADRAVRWGGAHVQYFSMPWDLGPRKAKEYLFTGDFISAAEAEKARDQSDDQERNDPTQHGKPSGSHLARPLGPHRLAKQSGLWAKVPAPVSQTS